STMGRDVMDWPTVGFTVSTAAPAPSTTTSSLTVPTSSLRSARNDWLICSGGVVASSMRNPSWRAMILYVPIGRFKTWEKTSRAVVVSAVIFVAVLVTVILAFDTTAPCASLIVPRIFAVACCPHANDEKDRARSRTNVDFRHATTFSFWNSMGPPADLHRSVWTSDFVPKRQPSTLFGVVW